MMPEVDISRMFELPRCAIHCANYEDASLLFSVVNAEHPALTGNFKGGNIGWDYGKNTCYTLFYETSKEAERLTRTSIDWFIKKGYEVIEFDDLCIQQTEISESEMPIESILGLN